MTALGRLNKSVSTIGFERVSRSNIVHELRSATPDTTEYLNTTKRASQDSAEVAVSTRKSDAFNGAVDELPVTEGEKTGFNYDDKDDAADLIELPIIERYSGFVECIQDEVALVTLRTPAGDELDGEYSAAELESMNIRANDYFDCFTFKDGESIGIKIVKRRAVAISARELAEFDRQLEEDFAGWQS